LIAFVLDASVAVNYVLLDQPIEVTRRVFSALKTGSCLVPPNFELELIQVLTSAERHGRISAQTADTFFMEMKTFSFVIEMPRRDSVISLCRQFGISAYDAAYLALAREQSVPLATYDQRLRDACQRASVSIY
jgi:predicted nucleic acid-binding protein